MANLSIILFISIVTPIAMMLFVFRDKARTILLFLIIGIFTCLFAGMINGLLLKQFNYDEYYLTVNVTPVIEEIIKGVPILLFAFLFNPKKQILFECSIVVGVGFAILENAFVIGSDEKASIILAIIRGFGAGMMHGVCTFCVGYGMSFVHTKRKLFYTGTIALLTAAVLYHSIFNTLIQSNYYIVGLLLPLATFIPIVILLRKNWKKEHAISN